MARDRFLLVGHSFVRKLNEACDSEERQYDFFLPNLGLRDGLVMMVGDFGRNKPVISYASQVEKWINEHPKVLSVTDVTQIDVGSNDLLQDWYCDARGLANKVYKIARKCLDMGSKRVVIRQILWRQGYAAIPRWSQDFRPEARNKARDIYNSSVVEYDIITTKVRAGSSRITVQKPSGLKLAGYQKLRDGVHLTDEGLKKYYAAVRDDFIRQGCKARR